jgi:lipoprotein-anchoring transpeptidase ErfK/SrfK
VPVNGTEVARRGAEVAIVIARDDTNFRKALVTFQAQNDLDANGRLDSATFGRLSASSSGAAITQYEITDGGIRGPFGKHIPKDYAAMAKLPALSYTGPRQKLAERFHMDEKLLVELNPRTDFGRSRVNIAVANVGARKSTKAARIDIDKQDRSLSAFNGEGHLVGFYPASVGSTEKPAPAGVYKVRGVALNPTYHDDPKFAFKGLKVKHKLTISPGPNNPVGVVWIDLSAPSYGIHGAPAPENIGKTESHGCIRLTNWDALDLASRVSCGTIVDLSETEPHQADAAHFSR